jgi:alpha-1,6-mannosyltransferase
MALACGAVAAETVLLLLFQAIGERRPAVGVTLLVSAFLPYGVAVWMALRQVPRNLPLWLGLTVLLHLVLLAQGPTLDDDLWRYRWDGKVVAAGINPYLHPPDADVLTPLRDAGWERISFKQVRTIYPPLAELLFAAGYRLDGHRLWPYRGAAIAAHLASIAVLILLLRGAGAPAHRAFLYAWNPLIVKEVADSGHMDPWMVLWLLAALLAYQRGRRRWVGPALAAAIGFKWVPLLTLPVWRRAGYRTLGLAVVLTAALLWPWGDARAHMFDGLLTFADYWVFNPGIYWGLRGLLDPLLALSTAKLVAKGICVGAWLAIYVLAARRQGADFDSLTDALFVVVGALLLLSPTLDPWYLTWVLPLACLCHGRLPIFAWWWLSAAATLSYLYYVNDTDVAWGRWIEYGVFGVLWVWEWRRRRGHPTYSQ